MAVLAFLGVLARIKPRYGSFTHHLDKLPPQPYTIYAQHWILAEYAETGAESAETIIEGIGR